MEQLIRETLKDFERLKSERSNWDNSFQLVAEYVWQTKADFTVTSITQGEFLFNKLYDTTAYDSMVIRASSFLSMVWGNGEFAFVPVHESIKEDQESLDFFQQATEIVKADLQDPKVNLDLALYQVELYLGSFGTGCLIVVQKEDDSIRFASLDLKEIYIDEDEYGNADTLFRRYELTVEQAIKKFGLENLSPKMKGLVKSKESNIKQTFLHIIRPRRKPKAKMGVLAMPFESLHIDYSNKYLIKESGFDYKPFFVCRENKKSDEQYGRGAGFISIADNKNLQTVTKDMIHIFNRYADPPTGSMNASITGGIIDKSPGGHTSFETTIQGQKPFFNLIEEFGGNLQALNEFRQSLKENITKKFDIDVLLDFNSEREMTAYEVNQRASMRQQALGSKFYSRIAEIYNPMLETIFQIYLSNSKFGYSNAEAEILKSRGIEVSKIIPDKVLNLIGNNEPVYDIVYYTPQAQEKMMIRAGFISI